MGWERTQIQADLRPSFFSRAILREAKDCASVRCELLRRLSIKDAGKAPKSAKKKPPPGGGLDSRCAVPPLLLLARFHQTERLLDIMNAWQRNGELFGHPHAGFASLQGGFYFLLQFRRDPGVLPMVAARAAPAPASRTRGPEGFDQFGCGLETIFHVQMRQSLLPFPIDRILQFRDFALIFGQLF